MFDWLVGWLCGSFVRSSSRSFVRSYSRLFVRSSSRCLVLVYLLERRRATSALEFGVSQCRFAFNRPDPNPVRTPALVEAWHAAICVAPFGRTAGPLSVARAWRDTCMGWHVSGVAR
jgi:hypothetical protein